METRKQEIVRIAAMLFKDRGYSAVTMRDLASVIGIKAASLYNHINSKSDILEEIIISLAEEFTKGMESIITSNNSCIGKLEKVIELHVKISSQNIDGMASLNNDWMHLEQQQSHYKKLRTDYENNFKYILKQGIASGEIINVKPDVMMFSILTTLHSLYLWIPKKEDINLQEFSNTLSQILINGINK